MLNVASQGAGLGSDNGGISVLIGDCIVNEPFPVKIVNCVLFSSLGT